MFVTTYNDNNKTVFLSMERSKSDAAEKVRKVVDPALRRGHSPPCTS